jgi:hypothetical protein
MIHAAMLKVNLSTALLYFLFSAALAFQQPADRRRHQSHALCETTDKSTLDWDKLSSKSKGGKGYDPQDFFEVGNDEDEAASVHIPSGGFSVSDELEAAQRDRFVTEVIPVDGLAGVAQLYTSPVIRGSFEPVRYLIAVNPPAPTPVRPADGDNTSAASIQNTTATADYVLIDVPPYSPQLVTRMKAFMGTSGRIRALLVTSRDNIHYDEMPSVFTLRRADLDLWRRSFPDMAVVSYRLDTPRDCKPLVTQILDGYGPFAMLENGTFVETGRPLTRLEWDFNTAETVMNGQRTAPDDDEMQACRETGANAEYSLESIRRKEHGKGVLAVFTPGHSFGSVSYVFPQQSVVASGFTIPVEETRAEDNIGGLTGPSLDCRGYISTSRAGIQRQMESARQLIEQYADRFQVVLPSRGDPLFLEDAVAARKAYLKEVIDQYDRIGQIYELLGITQSKDDE